MLKLQYNPILILYTSDMQFPPFSSQSTILTHLSHTPRSPYHQILPPGTLCTQQLLRVKYIIHNTLFYIIHIVGPNRLLKWYILLHFAGSNERYFHIFQKRNVILLFPFTRFQNKHSQGSYLYLVIVRWFAVRIDFISNLFLAAVVFSSISLAGSLDAALVGLSIMYTLSLAFHCQYCIRLSTEVENSVSEPLVVTTASLVKNSASHSFFGVANIQKYFARD